MLSQDKNQEGQHILQKCSRLVTLLLKTILSAVKTIHLMKFVSQCHILAYLWLLITG